MADLPPLSEAAQSLQLGTYRHYKGSLCQVLGVARHSEDPTQELVVYRHLDDGQIWVRPLAMFLETVEVDGHRKLRFERIEAGE
jgi:hypothetical protein